MFSKRLFVIGLSTMLLGSSINVAFAQNPVVQPLFTSDPAPVVFDGSLFMYTGHDEDGAPVGTYLMRDYQLFTTNDMVNFTYCGTPLRTSDFSWSQGDASAAQVIERNGKYYYYISSQSTVQGGGSGIGVAVSDSPYGPFHDALGEPLIHNFMTKQAPHIWDDLDPTVMIDDDGQAYLYWGNGMCYWVKLNEDMISIDGEIHALDVNDSAVTGPKYTEGPWVYKRDGHYYLVYASEFPENISYSMAKSAQGPWEHKGVIMPLQGGSNTNHSGVMDYKGHSYFFYHNDALEDGHGYDRSVAIEEFKYKDNGEFPQINMTAEGVSEPVGALSPYSKVEAETNAVSKGIEYKEGDGRIVVSDTHDGDFLKIRSVDFGNSAKAKSFVASTASKNFGGRIEIHLDTVDGELIGTLRTSYTGGWDHWTENECELSSAPTGRHDVFLVFKRAGRGGTHALMDLDWWYIK